MCRLYQNEQFLALLDYVSRAHEIEIRPSFVRLWHRLSLKFLHGFFSNFSCGFPWAICPDGFFISFVNFFLFFIFYFLRIFFVFVNMGPYLPMGAKTSKRYSSLKSLLGPFKLFLKFLLSGPHKSTVLDF